MTKEEAIKLAYGEHWETVKDYVDENGWLDKNVFFNTKLRYKDLSLKIAFEHSLSICKPKSLQGIEDNNGWIELKSLNDLPKEQGYYFFRLTNSINTTSRIIVRDVKLLDYYEKFQISHYQPIQKPKPPIY